MPVVYTGGTFDVGHPGHVYLLQQCKALAGPTGKVVVGLNPDEFILRYKNAPPTLTYGEREAMLLAYRYVDEVVANRSGEDSRPTIESVRPDIVAIGIDWAAKDYYGQMGFNQQWLDTRNITLVYLPHRPGLSSTVIKERVKR